MTLGIPNRNRLDPELSNSGMYCLSDVDSFDMLGII